MATDMSSRRLRKEFNSLMKAPLENIIAQPLETNILEWHYVITGTKGTPYEGGHYHGILRFPPEYPLKPPSILMYTPNGRFSTNRRLCLSMSDYHPETWNPVWSVGTILMGLYSFMLETAPTLGGIPTTTAEKRRYAADSLKFNCKDSTFRELFPELVRLYEDRTATNLASRASGNTDSNGSGSCGGEVAVRGAEIPGTDGLGGLVMTVSIVVAVGLLAVIFHIGEWNL